MLYDIRDAAKAAHTLEIITGVSSAVWLGERSNNAGRTDYSDVDKDIERIIKRNKGHYSRVDDFKMVITHVTTSGNGCKSILKDGIFDLQKAYQKKDSELRGFLESKGIEIRLDDNSLNYSGKAYDISFSDCPWEHESEEYYAWSIGRKFYYDYTVCGFYSINGNRPYGGNVHRCPEILWDIDNLLRTDLRREWALSHKAYEIVFRVPFRDIIYGGWDSETEEDIEMAYLTDAYMCISIGPDTMEVLCKNGVEIAPNQILECNRFTVWDR